MSTRWQKLRFGPSISPPDNLTHIMGNLRGVHLSAGWIFLLGASSYCRPDSPRPFGSVQGFVAGHTQHTAALGLCSACGGRTCANPLRWLEDEVQHPTMSKYIKKGYLHMGNLKGKRLYWGAGTKQRPSLWRYAWIHIVITIIFSAFCFYFPTCEMVLKEAQLEMRVLYFLIRVWLSPPTPPYCFKLSPKQNAKPPVF